MSAFDSFSTDPLVALAWLGTSVGAVDLSLVALGVLDVAPSVQLLGAGLGDVLVWGYLVAGIIAIGTDVVRFDS